MALAIALLCSAGAWAQTNLIAGWDGGNDTSSPSNFGWTSSAGRTLNGRNAGSGIRMMTTYSDYKDEDGNNYTYSSTSDPSSVIFWVRYKSSGESFTYTFKGLEPNHYYVFSGLVGWHNNSDNPTFTVVLNDGTNTLANMTKAVSTKQKLYSISSSFKTPETITNTTDVKIVFTCNKTGDCMEAISGLSLVEDNAAYEADLSKFIAYATQVNIKLSDSDLATAISTAQGIVDDGEDNATFGNVDDLKTAIRTAISDYSLDPAGDDVTSFIFRPGFEGMTPESANYGTAKGKDYSSEGWTMVETGDFGYGAIMSYGSEKTFNSASVPATDNAGNTGNTLGVSVGWGSTQRYQSEVITLPAGSYRLSVKAYNANAGAQQFTSKVGFVPTSGESSLSSKTSFTSNTWETDEIDFVLDNDTEGRFQIGGTAVSGGSGDNAKIFFDNISLTYFDPLKLAQIQWQEVWNNLNALDETALPNAAETAITDALAETEPTTVEGCNTAKAALQALIDSYDDIKAAYDKLSALIDLTNSEKENSTGDKTDFAAAISTATGNIETRTAADDLTNDYNTLESARQTYVTGGAQPTAGHVFDYTFKISDAAITTANDWKSKRLQYNQQYTGAPDNTYFDNNNENRNIQKNIGTLRLGKYELKCATRAHAGVTVGNIYVSQNAANLNQTNIHHDGNTGGDLGNGWSWTTVPFDNYVGDKDITLGFYSECGSSKWAGADDFHLYYKGNTVDNETAEALKETVVSEKMNATVASTQATALSNFESEQTFENYNTLKSAIDAASNSKTVYEGIDAAITKVEGWTATTAPEALRTKYNNGLYSDETKADNIYAEYQEAEITALAAASATDWTSAIINASFETGDMTGWTATSRYDTGVKETNNATYSITSGDITSGSYMFNSWGGTDENDVKQTIKNLPAGTYTLVAVLAGFPGESLVIAANEETGTTVVAGDKTVGYLTSVTFTLDATADVVIKASNTKSQTGSDASFIKADNFQLYVGSSVPASASKPNLLYAINNATNARKSANEGAGIFQIPAAAGTELAGAISIAQAVYDNASATLEQINQAVTDVDAARTTYEGTELNVPAEGDVFNLYLDDGLKKTVTFKAGNQSSGGYAIGYTDDAGSFYNQAIHFKSTETKNQYKLYIIDDAGTKHYLCTGAVYSGNNNQIRVTDNEENALAVEVIATTTNGIYNLKNTAADALIGSNGDAGVYTAQTYKNFNINPAAKCVVPVAVNSGKWSTRIFPFAVAEVPDGLEVYTATGISGASIVMSDALSSIPANTPVLIKATTDVDVTLQGYGTATADSYKDAAKLLTGFYTAKTIDAGNYVLQTQDGVQAFYRLAENATAKQGYRAYLTVPVAGDVKAFYFDFNDATAISETLAPTGRAGEGPIYNLAGQKMSKLQKGVNIVNGKKVLVK